MNIYQFVVALVLGVLSGWLYERSRSLIPCIALHVSYNSALTILDWIGRTDRSSLAQANSASMWAGAAVLAASSVAVLARVLRRAKYSP
jgi:membrane protease YdiL (CAAX protease family)